MKVQPQALLPMHKAAATSSLHILYPRILQKHIPTLPFYPLLFIGASEGQFEYVENHHFSFFIRPQTLRYGTRTAFFGTCTPCSGTGTAYPGSLTEYFDTGTEFFGTGMPCSGILTACSGTLAPCSGAGTIYNGTRTGSYGVNTSGSNMPD